MGEAETQENLKGGKKRKHISAREENLLGIYLYFIFYFCSSLSIILWIVSRRGRGRVREDRI